MATAFQGWLAVLAILLMGSVLQAAPVVSNVSAAQRAGTKLVEISYDVSAEGFATVAIKIEASSDGGTSWTVPVQTISGAVGEAVPVGTGKTAVWDAAADWAGNISSQMRFRVTTAYTCCRR